jgi:predicted acylesterase/phospholipase RssA
MGNERGKDVRALLLSGGGSRGAYQIGALKAMCDNHIISSQNTFDMIHGFSVGAINGAGLAQFEKCDIDSAVNFVANMWLNKIEKTSDIWTWKIPKLKSVSLGDVNKLYQLIDDNVDYTEIMLSDIDLTISATNFNHGMIEIINKNNPYFKEFIKASSAFPIYFPPVKIGDELYMDGHLSEKESLSHLIKKGATDITIIDTSKSNRRDYHKGILGVIRDTIRIAIENHLYSDYVKCTKINEDIINGINTDKRIIKLNYIQPSGKLSKSLDFNKKSIFHNYSMGYRDIIESLSGLNP